MGIYDRDYYRGEGYSFLGSFSERGKVCKWLIGINVALFICQLLAEPSQREVFQRRQQQEFIRQTQGQPTDEEEGSEPIALPTNLVSNALELDAGKVLHGQVWRILTYAFLHSPGSFYHILFNMLFLWWFGSDVEDLYGQKEFLAIYLTAAVLGGLVFTIAWKVIPGQGERCIGASGAVMAVLVLCAIHYPTRIIYLFFFLPVPIWLFVIFEVAQDSFGFLSRQSGNTAVTVHLAGAAFAFVYYKANLRLTPMVDSVRNWQRQLFRPRLRVYREEPREPVPVASPQIGSVDEQLEAQLDAVLEKLTRYGEQSLSENEKQILMRASEIYKRRRT
jgi:membrane associated rhomboid family serine protease